MSAPDSNRWVPKEWRICIERHKRHAYAAYQLEAGLPVHQLQRLLGHSNIKSTERYAHWIHNYREGREAVADLVGTLEVSDE